MKDKTQISIRYPSKEKDNLNHHLYLNRSMWWIHFTVHHKDNTSQRIRQSLLTGNVITARRRRDAILNDLQTLQCVKTK